jgi:hypothetical protein
MQCISNRVKPGAYRRERYEQERSIRWLSSKISDSDIPMVAIRPKLAGRAHDSMVSISAIFSLEARRLSGTGGLQIIRQAVTDRIEFSAFPELF